MNNNETETTQVVSEFVQMSSLLLNDVKQCRVLLEAQDTQFGRRIYIRTLFAHIEGITFQMKQDVLHIYEIKGWRCSEGELALLKEEAYELDDKGEVYVQMKPLQLRKNMRFAFKMFSHALGIDYELDVSSEGWSSLKESINIRNNITHPKHLDDLSISDEQLSTAKKADIWYALSIHRLLSMSLSGPTFRSLDETWT